MHLTFIRPNGICREMGWHAGCTNKNCDWTHDGSFAEVDQAARGHHSLGD